MKYAKTSQQRFVHLFAFCPVCLVKQLQAWFISAPPDKETKHWFIMPNHVSTLPSSSPATKVIRISLEQLNGRACQPEETPAHRLANKTDVQWQTNRVRGSPCTCPSNLKQSSKAGKHAKSCQWFPLAAGQISHLPQSSKADQHANSCQWFPLAAGQISHLTQSSKADQHANSCQWFPLAAGQISHLPQSSKADQHANSCQWFTLAAAQIQTNIPNHDQTCRCHRSSHKGRILQNSQYIFHNEHCFCQVWLIHIFLILPIIHRLIAVANKTQFSHTYHIYVHTLSITDVLAALRFLLPNTLPLQKKQSNKSLTQLRQQVRSTNLFSETRAVVMSSAKCHVSCWACLTTSC